MGEVLNQRKITVDAGDVAGRQAITVHLDGTISRRSRDKAFSGQNFTAEAGDLVFSKIDARQGAVAILPASIPAAFVTSEFPVFSIDNALIEPGYVDGLIHCPHFIATLAVSASGTSGRKRVTPQAFEALTIPLPALPKQRELVAAHAAAIASAEKNEVDADRVEAAGREAFAAALGLASPPPLPDRPVFVARFAELDRWGHEAALRRVERLEAPSAAYPLVKLGEVIADLENGWSPQCLDRPAEPGEWGVLKLGAVSFGEYDEAENKALPPQLSPRANLEIQAGQVLVSRANVTRLVGATAFVRETRSHLMLCDKIFRFVFDDQNRLDPEFVAEALRMPSVREQIEASLTGTSPTMKNISKPALLALTFPLPPLETQRALVADLTAERIRAAALRDEAAAGRAAARAEFEGAIWE